MAAGLGLLAACAPEQATPPPAAPAPPPPVAVAPPPLPALPAPDLPPPVTTDQPFDAWKAAFATYAVAQGVRPETVAAAFAGLTPSEAVLALDQRQFTGKAVFAAYHARHMSAARTRQGRNLIESLKSALQQIEIEHGIPATALVALYGIETNYGQLHGRTSVIRAVATLAHHGRRAALFQGELLATLRLLDRGMVTADALTGSWAGASGLLQFMPSNILNHAVDQNRDGKIDIWRDPVDALGSAANYLKHSGWQAGQGWLVEVLPPPGFDPATVSGVDVPVECSKALARHSRAMPTEAWRSLGFQLAGDGAWPVMDTATTLIQPDGPAGRSFLALPNYRVLLRYNCSNFYALTVGLLAHELAL